MKAISKHGSVDSFFVQVLHLQPLGLPPSQYVTGSAKTLHFCTKSDIHFIAQDYNCYPYTCLYWPL